MKLKKVERIDFSCTRKEAETILSALKFYAEDDSTSANNSAYAFDLEDKLFCLLYTPEL